MFCVFTNCSTYGKEWEKQTGKKLNKKVFYLALHLYIKWNSIPIRHFSYYKKQHLTFTESCFSIMVLENNKRKRKQKINQQKRRLNKVYYASVHIHNINTLHYIWLNKMYHKYSLNIWRMVGTIQACIQCNSSPNSAILGPWQLTPLPHPRLPCKSIMLTPPGQREMCWTINPGRCTAWVPEGEEAKGNLIIVGL